MSSPSDDSGSGVMFDPSVEERQKKKEQLDRSRKSIEEATDGEHAKVAALVYVGDCVRLLTDRVSEALENIASELRMRR